MSALNKPTTKNSWNSMIQTSPKFLFFNILLSQQSEEEILQDNNQNLQDIPHSYRNLMSIRRPDDQSQ